MATIKLNAQSGNLTNDTHNEVIIELVKAHARDVAATVANMTDSSGGTGGAALLAASTSLVAVPNAATNLAGKAAAEAALATVTDAVKELYTKANEYAVKLGVDQITYNGGGATADGTIGAITVVVTPAATGAVASNTNTILAAYNAAFYKLAVLTNKLAVATGKTKIGTSAVTTDFTSTVAAIPTDTGTAADPGVSAAALNAELVKLRTNVATVATLLNSINDGLGNAAVIAI